MRILAIGQSVRNVACSASRAGHEVIAADYYRDLDLVDCVFKAVAIPPLPDSRGCVQACIDKYCPDAVVLGPGLEEVQAEGALVLNNPPRKTAQVSDKLWLGRWLDAEGYPSIPTRSPGEEADLPAVIKPRKGAGGVGCVLVQTPGDPGLNLSQEYIVQDFVEGLPASASVISNGSEAVTISVNEQIIGADWTGASGFRYSGNITPLDADTALMKSISAIAEDVVSGLGLVGNNGVDFIISDQGPLVVEVNPRFQGSLAPIELSTEKNVFQAHLDSFSGHIPAPDSQKYARTAGRAVIYADRDIKVERDLRCEIEGMADVPRPGSAIARDEPLASILATGQDRARVIAKLIERASRLRYALKQKTVGSRV